MTTDATSLSGPQAPPIAPAGQPTCPLCERVLKQPHKCKPIYGVIVCRKCRNGFANRRQLAYVIDSAVWWAATAVPLYYMGLISGLGPQLFSLNPPVDGSALDVFFNYVFPLTFYFKDGFGGKSPGKALCGVQVVDVATLEPAGFGKSFKRNLCLIIPLVALLVALLMMKGRRWGDGWAKTKVVWCRHAFKLPFDQRGIKCTGCGYDLTGNTSGRCPECFKPVPNPATAVDRPDGEPAV